MTSYNLNDFLNKITSSGNIYTSNYSKRVREADTDVQDLQKELESFQKNVRNLKNYDEDSFTKKKMERQLTSFVKGYNSIKKAADKANNSNIQKEMDKLDHIIEDHAKSLSKLGIKMKDNTLKFDKETFDDVEEKDMKKLLKKLFVGSDSFIAQVNKEFRKLDKTSDSEEYHINLRRFHSITQYSDEEITVAEDAYALKNTYIPNCQNAVKNVDSNIEDTRISCLNGFTSCYNDMMSVDNSGIKEMQAFIEENDVTKLLSGLGISIKEDHTLSYDDTLQQDSDFCTAYEELFGENSPYVEQINQLCDKVINTALKADKIGITFDMKV